MERNSKMEILFDGGDVRTVDLKNLDSVQTFKMDPQPITKSVKFTIKKVYSQVNNGGGFNVFGTSCVDPKELEDTEPVEEAKDTSADCEDTLISDKFDSMGLKDGGSLVLTCMQSCKDDKVQVYGDLMYSEDSGICRSAFHSGALSDKGGQFLMKIESGLNEYKGSFRSGVQSKSK